MNWNKLKKGCSISMQLVSVIAVLIVTFFQFLKYKKEITNISISYNDGKQDLDLPSITFCPFFWELLIYCRGLTAVGEAAMNSAVLPLARRRGGVGRYIYNNKSDSRGKKKVSVP